MAFSLQLAQMVPIRACCQALLKARTADSSLSEGLTGIVSPQDNFVDVIRNNEFLELPPDEVAALLAMDDLNIPSEEVIFYVSSRTDYAVNYFKVTF